MALPRTPIERRLANVERIAMQSVAAARVRLASDAATVDGARAQIELTIDGGDPGLVLDTTEQTLIGAINELKAEIAGLGSGGGGAGLSGAAVLAVPYGAPRFRWQEAISGLTGVVAGVPVFAHLAPSTDTQNNPAEGLDVRSIEGVAGTDQITFTINFRVAESGPVNIIWRAG